MKAHPLSGLEISQTLSSYPGFQGVHARDALPKQKLKPGEFQVINLDSSTGPGTHWVGLYSVDKSTTVYFDPFGLPPPEEVVKKYKTKNHNVIYTTSQVQGVNSIRCGYYVIQFLSRLATSSDIYQALHDFDQEPSERNERDVIKQKLHRHVKQNWIERPRKQVGGVLPLVAIGTTTALTALIGNLSITPLLASVAAELATPLLSMLAIHAFGYVLKELTPSLSTVFKTSVDLVKYLLQSGKDTSEIEDQQENIQLIMADILENAKRTDMSPEEQQAEAKRLEDKINQATTNMNKLIALYALTKGQSPTNTTITQLDQVDPGSFLSQEAKRFFFNNWTKHPSQIAIGISPVETVIQTLLNITTLGALKKKLAKLNISDLIHPHISFIFQENGKKSVTRYEREALLIVTDHAKRKGTDRWFTPYITTPTGLLIGHMVRNHQAYYNSNTMDVIRSYSPRDQNSQTFVYDFLKANGLQTDQITNFSKQDTNKIMKDFDLTNALVNKIVALGSSIDNMLGKGI